MQGQRRSEHTRLGRSSQWSVAKSSEDMRRRLTPQVACAVAAAIVYASPPQEALATAPSAAHIRRFAANPRRATRPGVESDSPSPPQPSSSTTTSFRKRASNVAKATWAALWGATFSTEVLLTAFLSRRLDITGAVFTASMALRLLFRASDSNPNTESSSDDTGNFVQNVFGDGVASQLEDTARHKRKRKALSQFRVLEQGDAEYVDMDAVRGNSDLRSALLELVEVLKNPRRFIELGVQPPIRGVLFTGPPGTGKTFAARAIASEAGVPYVYVSGADLRSSPYVGQGSELTIEIFNAAMRRAPCMVFIDEIDSVARKRRSGDLQVLDAGLPGESVSSDAENNVNALLALMEQLPPGVLVVGATNRPHIIDGALLRSGRFDRRIEFKLPDLQGREDILRHHSQGLTFAQGEQAPDFSLLAKEAAAFSPADLRAVLREAALSAARRGSADGNATDVGVICVEDVEAAIQEIATVKSRALPLGRFQVIQRPSARLKDVQGCDDAVRELQDLCDYLEDPGRFAKLGAELPRGVLLEGPPGVGKTLAARALAGETGVPFLCMAGTEFQSSAIAGQGAQMVKELFAQARSMAPSLIFLDEVDAVGRARGSAAMGAQQDRENTLMQLLVEMDGFDKSAQDGVTVLAATNRPELLDAALRRPGRFDRTVSFKIPDEAGREAILRLHAEGKKLCGSSDNTSGNDVCPVDFAAIASAADGCSGAELKAVMNEAALRAGRRRAECIEQSDIIEALKSVKPEKKSQMGFLSD